VLHTVEDLAKKNIIQLHFVNILPDGSVDLAHLEKLVKQYSNQSLVTLMHANNEIGNMLDLETVSLLCEENGAYFHTDTVQTIGLYPFDLKKLKVDFLVASAHKFHGLKGTGFIYIGDGIRITPFIKGGAQERNMRGGTENTIGIIACAKALELAHSDQEQKRDYIKSLKKYFIDKLKQTVPEAIFNGTSGDIENSLLTVVNVLFPKTKISEMLLFNFDIHGVAVSGGSACTSGTNIGSHVLSTLYGEQDERPAIRFSFSQYNTFAELDYTIDVMNKLFNK
jgi:cysteine desulfurase